MAQTDATRTFGQRRVLTVFDRLGELASEHAELERALADPGVHADAGQARTLAKRCAELTPIGSAFREWQQAGEDEQAARELASEDPAFAAEAEQLAARRAELADQLRVLLVPKDPNDARPAAREVKAGGGGAGPALSPPTLPGIPMRSPKRKGRKTKTTPP